MSRRPWGLHTDLFRGHVNGVQRILLFVLGKHPSLVEIEGDQLDGYLGLEYDNRSRLVHG